MSNASRIVPHDRRSWSSSNSSKLIKRVSVNREKKKKKKKAILWTILVEARNLVPRAGGGGGYWLFRYS